MDGVSMSGNVQGSVDKNSGAPPWRDMGQWMEFPCPEMCRDPWIKTPVPLPGGIWANGRSFHVQKCAGCCISACSTQPTRPLTRNSSITTAHAHGHLGDFGPYRFYFR